MILGSMQPYFFPYLGYFALIKHSDRFVFFDTPQYIRHGWCNRNRILKQDGTPTYITIPIRKAPYDTPINKTLIDNGSNWRGRLYGQLDVYRKIAPRYRQVRAFLEEILSPEYDSLSLLCIETTKAVCSLLGIESEFSVFSEMNLALEEVHAPDEWALNTAKALGYDCYVNPPGGMSFYSREKYEASGVRLEFLSLNLREYSQGSAREFVPGLSVIDALMFCETDEVYNMLDDYEIL